MNPIILIDGTDLVVLLRRLNDIFLDIGLCIVSEFHVVAWIPE